jgi:hypothetical protein
MELLAVAIFVMASIGVFTGSYLVYRDKQIEWEKRNKK